MSIFDQYVSEILMFVESKPDDAYSKSMLYPSDLYNFYFIATLHGQGRLSDDYAKFVSSNFINRLKEKYVKLFSELIFNQIKKYISRGRVDPEVTMDRLESSTSNLKELEDMMAHTYRSDMKRRNTVWDLVASYTCKLSQSSSIKDSIFFIDRINNCVHNTQELMFSKFSNYSRLLQAFDSIHRATSLDHYKSKVDKDFRQILNN